MRRSYAGNCLVAFCVLSVREPRACGCSAVVTDSRRGDPWVQRPLALGPPTSRSWLGGARAFMTSACKNGHGIVAATCPAKLWASIGASQGRWRFKAQRYEGEKNPMTRALPTTGPDVSGHVPPVSWLGGLGEGLEALEGPGEVDDHFAPCPSKPRSQRFHLGRLGPSGQDFPELPLESLRESAGPILSQFGFGTKREGTKRSCGDTWHA